jgi:preprotein translocase SecE subunit
MADEIVNADESRGPARFEPAAAAPRAVSRSPFRPYKPGQGVHVRWGSAAGGGVIAVAGAAFVREWMRVPFGDSLVLQTLIPVALLAVVFYLLFWFIGRHHGVVDFMIATEGEMKKVNWSSRKEIWGATKVVIVTTLLLGLLLGVVDFVFMLLFISIGVLKIPFWQSLLGTGGVAQ